MFEIGVDIVKKDRISFLIEKYGDKFLKRVFSPEEIAYCMGKKNRSECFAGKFAAKEAFIKAKGGAGGVALKEIEILNNPEGKPFLRLKGEAYSSSNVALSISHEKEYAVAVCLILKGGEG